jgi:hypothetical protein
MPAHTCPYPGCDAYLPEQMFACKPHWFSLPIDIRNGIWRAYRREGIGSEELLEAHVKAFDWWERPTPTGG